MLCLFPPLLPLLPLSLQRPVGSAQIPAHSVWLPPSILPHPTPEGHIRGLGTGCGPCAGKGGAGTQGWPVLSPQLQRRRRPGLLPGEVGQRGTRRRWSPVGPGINGGGGGAPEAARGVAQGRRGEQEERGPPGGDGPLSRVDQELASSRAAGGFRRSPGNRDEIFICSLVSSSPHLLAHVLPSSTFTREAPQPLLVCQYRWRKICLPS